MKTETLKPGTTILIPETGDKYVRFARQGETRVVAIDFEGTLATISKKCDGGKDYVASLTGSGGDPAYVDLKNLVWYESGQFWFEIIESPKTKSTASPKTHGT